MPSVCLACGTGLTRRERSNKDRKCMAHTKHRRDRVQTQLAHSPQEPFQIPVSLKRSYASLTSTWDKEDKDGGGKIYGLAPRPDCQAVNALSKVCWKLRTENKHPFTETDSVAWVLIANRVYDTAVIKDLMRFLLMRKQCAFSRKTFDAFVKEVENGIVEGKKLGSPSGCAGAHSGITFMRDLQTENHFDEFKRYCHGLAGKLRNQFKGPSSTKELWEAITLRGMKKQDRPKILHTGWYYKMQVYRVLRHCFHLSHPRRGRKPCVSSEYLWHKVLLKYDGGARAAAKTHGLLSWRKAATFVSAMQKGVKRYCMCDVSCWLCLEHSNS
jgi:hypothetical protein